MTSDPTTSCTTSHYCTVSSLCTSFAFPSGQQASSDKQHRPVTVTVSGQTENQSVHRPDPCIRSAAAACRFRHPTEDAGAGCPAGSSLVPTTPRTTWKRQRARREAYVRPSQVTTWRRCWRAAARTAATRRRTARRTGPAHRTRPPQTKGGTKARRRRAGARRWPTAARPPGPR